MHAKTRPAPWWKRLALSAALVALALPLTACQATPEFLFCLFSAGAVSAECRTEALAPGAPSPPVDVVATSTPPGVDLSWPASLEPDVEGYRIYRSEGPGGPYAFLTTVRGDSTSALDESAAGCVRLYYVVTAFDTLEQESLRSAEASTTCGPPDRPSGLRAFGFPTSILLVWAPSREPDLAGYNVFLHTPEEGGQDKLNAELLTSPEFHVAGLATLTTYFFHVTAVDTGGRQSAPAQVGPVKTVEASGIPPTAPTALTVLRHVADGRLEWADNPEPDIVGYHVYRADAAAGPYTRVTDALVRESHHLADVGAEQWFRVTAVNSSDEEGPPSEPVFATPDPAAPTGLRATAGDGEVSLTWNANVEGDLAGYVVYARIGPTESARGLTDTSFRHLGLVNGVEVLYSVVAVDTSGHVSDQTQTSATPEAAQRPPSAPTGLTASPGDHLVALDWADNGEPDVVGYDVELATTETGPFNSALRRPVTVSQHTIVDLPVQPFFFRVVAIDTSGARSAPSALVSATPCQAICVGPALSRLLRPSAAAAGPAAVPFRLTVSGVFDEGGTSRLDGDAIAGTGFGFTGTFTLDPALKGLDPELKELARAGLGGSWRARVDWRLAPGAGTGTTSGIALATFSNPDVGVACVRFEDTSMVKRRGAARRVVTNGAFTFLGGTEAAAKLLGSGSYGVESRPDGSMLYDGRALPAAGAAPLPAGCLALAGP